MGLLDEPDMDTAGLLDISPREVAAIHYHAMRPKPTPGIPTLDHIRMQAVNGADAKLSAGLLDAMGEQPNPDFSILHQMRRWPWDRYGGLEFYDPANVALQYLPPSAPAGTYDRATGQTVLNTNASHLADVIDTLRHETRHRGLGSDIQATQALRQHGADEEDVVRALDARFNDPGARSAVWAERWFGRRPRETAEAAARDIAALGQPRLPQMEMAGLLGAVR